MSSGRGAAAAAREELLELGHVLVAAEEHRHPLVHPLWLERRGAGVEVLGLSERALVRTRGDLERLRQLFAGPSVLMELGGAAVRRLVLPEAHVGFVYVLEGAVAVGPAATAVAKGNAAALSGGAALDLAAGAEGASVFFAFAAPLNEPVARYGPFVMNTREQIEQAIQDYQLGTLTH